MITHLLAQLQQLHQQLTGLQIQQTKTEKLNKIIHSATLALTQTFDLDTILQTLLNYIEQLVPFDSASVMLRTADNNILKMHALSGFDRWAPSAPLHTKTYNLRTIPNIKTVLTQQTSMIVDDTQLDPTWAKFPETAYVRSWLGVPLVVDNYAIGLFSLDKAEANFFVSEQIMWVERLAPHVAVAIRNAQLYQQAQSELLKRQQMEIVSEQNARKYEELVQQAKSVILEWDKDGTITFINNFGLEFFGYGPGELVGQNVIGTIVPKTETSGRDLAFLMQNIMKNPKVYSHNENENITKSGERVWAVWSNTPQFDHEGNFVGILSIANDVTPQKEAEQVLHRQNEYLAALNATTLGLMNHLELNELLETIIVRAGQLLGTSHGSIYLIDHKEHELELKVGVGLFNEKIGTRLQIGESLPGQVWQTQQPIVVHNYQTWDDKSDTFNNSKLRAGIGVPLTQTNRTDFNLNSSINIDIIGILSVGYDYTTQDTIEPEDVALLSRFAQLASVALDNARLYTQIQEARDIAQNANEAKSAFLANVSHELRTPLTSVLGFAKLIQKRLKVLFPLVKTKEPRTRRAMKQVRQNLDIIIAEGERLTALINDVLDLAKIEAGKIEWHMEPLEVNALISRAVVATSALFDQKKLALSKEVDPNLPQIIGDKDRLLQVLINLLANAVKFTDTGQITCRAVQSNNQVIISVIDTGTGIPASELETVFDKFKQVGDTLTDKPKGTGLGLPICKEIITNHEGHIWVESELGQGATFSFSLPILSSTSISPMATAWMKKLDIDLLIQQFERHHQAIAASTTPSEKNILVVDDENHIRELLRQELESRNYNVIEAQNGLDALRKIKTRPPDLIVLDIMMPKMNGFDIIRLLRDDPLTANIPLIVLSIVEDKNRGYSLGVDRYFHKPLDTAKLLAEIETLLSTDYIRRKVLVVDKDYTKSRNLTDLLRLQGYQVAQLFEAKQLIPHATALQPDMIIINSVSSTEILKQTSSLRLIEGLENVMLFFFQED